MRFLTDQELVMLNNLEISNDVLFAVDLQGIALVNEMTGRCEFIKYPEAAVWLLLIDNNDRERMELMLQAILGKNENDTKLFINLCLEKWKDLFIVD
jgi:hypothetical protein